MGGSEFNRGELSYVIGIGRSNDVLVLVGSTCQICRWWAHATCFGLCCGRQGFHEAMGQTGWDTDVLQCYTSLVGNDGKRGSTKCSARPSLLIWLSPLDSFPRDSKRFWRVPLVENSRKTAMAVSSLAKSLQQIAFRPGHGKTEGNRTHPDTRSDRKGLVFPMFSPEEVFWQVLRERIMAALTQVECSETGDKAEWPVMASLYLWKSVRKWEVIDQIMKWCGLNNLNNKKWKMEALKWRSSVEGLARMEDRKPTNVERIWSARSRHWSNNNSDIGCYPTQDWQNWWQGCFHHSIIDRTNQWCSYTGNWNKTSGDAGIMYKHVQTISNEYSWVLDRSGSPVSR